eukprot:2378764-Lingulodinium_polyedra.AAC.1
MRATSAPALLPIALSASGVPRMISAAWLPLAPMRAGGLSTILRHCARSYWLSSALLKTGCVSSTGLRP